MPDLSQDLIRADTPARQEFDAGWSACIGEPGGHACHRRGQKIAAALIGRQQGVHMRAEFQVVRAGSIQKLASLRGVPFPHRFQEVLYLLPPFRCHGCSAGARTSSPSWRYSSALAIRQSRLTVMAETPSTPAISSSVNPPKNRSRSEERR